MKYSNTIKYLNLSLLIVFPLSWFSPLLETNLVPTWLGGSVLFEAETLTIISGLQALWETDIYLALVVTFFALVAPMLKCLGIALIHFDLLTDSVKTIIAALGKLAMADIFLLALYIVIAKGIGIGEIEVAWGLYVFTSAVMLSLLLSFAQRR